MIQGVITRMAGQSSTIKGWMITLVAALLSVGAAARQRPILVLSLYVVVAMAFLDSYYLAIERKYRILYNSVCLDHAPPWSMEISKPTIRDVLSALRSPATSLLYSSAVLVVIGTLILV